jgi:hypothetical protein
MSVNQLIENLEAIRARYGSHLPVVMSDMEPVVRAGVSEGTELTPGPIVVITDRFEDVEADE